MGTFKDLLVTGSARILGTLTAKKVKAETLQGILPGSNVSEDETHRFLWDRCRGTSDWNNAISTGFWMGSSAANGPTTDRWYFGIVIVHTTDWIRQEVYPFTDSGSDPIGVAKYVRHKFGGSWGSWANESFTADITLVGGNWSTSAPYTQTVNVAGVTAGMDLLPTLNISGWSAADVKWVKKRFAMIDEGITNNGSVTFKCYNKRPSDANIPLHLAKV